MAHATAQFFGSPPPWGLGEGPKGQISLNLNTKSISKIFKLHFECLLTNERYKTYQTGFLFNRMGHAPGVGLRGTMRGWGVKKKFPKFNRFSESYLHEWHMQQLNFLVPASWGLGEGPKGKISLNLNYKVNFKDF